MMAFSSIPGGQVMSDLLTIREKGVLFTLLEPHCKLIKTTVAQILQAKVTQGERPSWHRLDCGVVCLIKDESVCSYYLRLYCVKRAKLLWEQEIYIPFNYTASRSYFHTFSAEVHQVGLNFANETEAEEFHLAVQTVHEKISNMFDMKRAATESSLSSDKNESMKITNEDKDFTLNASSTPASPPTSPFKDLDPTMRRLLTQASLSEEDLKEKDVAEAVDCIIKKFGGLKAVERELKTRGSVSQTLPRAAGTSISLGLQKGDLPSVHSFCDISEPGSLCSATLNGSRYDPSPPPAPATGGKRKSDSFKLVSSKNNGDPIMIALREVFKQKQMIQQKTADDANQEDLDTNNDKDL